MYRWKRLRLTKTSRIIELSGMNLKDQDFIGQVSKLSHFTNVR